MSKLDKKVKTRKEAIDRIQRLLSAHNIILKVWGFAPDNRFLDKAERLKREFNIKEWEL